MLDKLKENINKYSEKITSIKKEAQETRKQLLQNKFGFFLENKQINMCDKKHFDISMVGVDSGFYNSFITGLDFVLVQTAGTYMHYKNNKLQKYIRLNKNAETIFNDFNLQTDEITKFVSITRIVKELKLLTNAIKEKNPDVAFVDGSIIPQPIDRPNNKSKLYPKYITMLETFVKLYDTAKNNNTLLIGSIEDSRANTFLKEINKTQFNDIFFLDYVLKEQEGLGFFKTFATESNIIKQDLETYGNFDFFVSYVKPNKDIPLRIETNQKNYIKIRNIVCYLSSFYQDYAYPIVLIDADKQAKLTSNQINTLNKTIKQEFLKLGILDFRRNRRV